MQFKLKAAQNEAKTLSATVEEAQTALSAVIAEKTKALAEAERRSQEAQTSKAASDEAIKKLEALQKTCDELLARRTELESAQSATVAEVEKQKDENRKLVDKLSKTTELLQVSDSNP